MPSRRTVLRTAGTATVVASAGCAAPLAASGDESTEAAVTRTLITVAHGDDEIEAVTYDHVASVGEVRRGVQRGGFALPITLTDEGVDSLTEALRTAGALADPDGAELRLYVDGERQRTFRLGSDLAAAIREGEYDGEFLLYVASREDAESLREDLTAGTTGTST